MRYPLTVALLTYNRAEYLKLSLSAIINQTYKNFELLILDNGSSDDTPNVVLGFNDERIRYVRNPPGHTAFFNFLSAIRISRGERIIVTHDDDIMEPEMLFKQMELIKARPDITAVWTNAKIIDEEGNVIQDALAKDQSQRVYEKGEYLASMTEAVLWYPPSSMIFSHRLLSNRTIQNLYFDVIGARKRRTSNEGDQILPAQMNLSGPVAYINEPLLKYRRHPGQETNTAHLTKTALNLFRALLRLVNKAPYLKEYQPIFKNQIIRFKVQDIVMSVSKELPGENTINKVGLYFNISLVNSLGNSQSIVYMLPIYIFLLQIGFVGLDKVDVRTVDFDGLLHRRWVSAIRVWTEKRQLGFNIFSGLDKGSRLVIVGSVLIAAILIIEAREAGFEIVCCLDSNVHRQNNNYFGVPVCSHSWLEGNISKYDLIVTTSERDNEAELDGMIRRYDEHAEIKSWKDILLG